MLLALCLTPMLAHAAESLPVASARAVATLVSETDAIAAGKPFRIGLRLRLAPGWHTYWKNPGDAGAAPELNLVLPPGAAAGGIAWPAPDPLREGPVATYAYTGELLLPVRITTISAPATTEATAVPARIEATAVPARIEATAEWLVCKEICVPEHGSFRLELPTGVPTPSVQAMLFTQADARLPRENPFLARIGPDGTLRIEGAGIDPGTVAEGVFLAAEPGEIAAASPQALAVRPGSLTLKLSLDKLFQPSAPLDGVLTLHDHAGQRADFAVHATPGAPAAPGISARIILVAFLSGLILNAMPCVFPILAMKAFSLVSAGRDRARTNAMSYTAGILVAFSALGAILLALRASGGAAGWGFQFQSPVFVAGMAWLLFAVGLNFSGVF